MIYSRFADESTLTYEEAIKTATLFLNQRGYKNVKESYYAVVDGIMTINFAFYENGITYYTDLIKVSVNLTDGSVTAFDATGYLMNHTKRALPKKVKYTLSSGKKLIRKNLQIISSKKAFIPTKWGTENYTYEYHCVDKKGQEVLLYIDPVTGEEKDLLLLLYKDGGVLTK
jgi:germination protein YpeB